MGRRLDEVGESSKQLCQPISSSAAALKELVAVHGESESHKAKTGSLDKVLKVSRKEVASLIGVVEEQWARSNAAASRMAELSNHPDEACASTATCRKELLQVQNNAVAALSKVKVTSACAIVISKKRVAVNTKFEKQRFSVEQLVRFANKEIARLGGKGVEVTLERDVSMTKAEKLSL